MFDKLDFDKVSVGIKNSLENTWGNRYNIVVPNIKLENGLLNYSTSDLSIQIDFYDEIILTIIMKHMFMPLWLIKQCYSHNNLFDAGDISEKIDNWVKLGIVWKEKAVTGIYIRPTYALFNLFGIKNIGHFEDIPFNMLTHTICEQQVMFSIMSGESDITKREIEYYRNNVNKNFKLLPKISELGLPVNKNNIYSTNVLTESDFRLPFFDPKDIKQVENEINNDINNKVSITRELKDFKYFAIWKNNSKDEFNNNRKDWKCHLPDLVIPLPRIEGKSTSIAIEIELTNKRYAYEETLSRYKDNNRYGSVYWLCNSSDTANYIKNAFKEIGGTGSCRTVLSEFIIPNPEF